jgi:predicted transcriptional regulator
MSTLSLRLPESIHQKLGEVAEKEGISINQLINSAVAEKLSALLTEQYLSERASRGDRKAFDAVLAKIPNAPAAPGDELPVKLSKSG